MNNIEVKVIPKKYNDFITFILYRYHNMIFLLASQPSNKTRIPVNYKVLKVFLVYDNCRFEDLGIDFENISDYLGFSDEVSNLSELEGFSTKLQFYATHQVSNELIAYPFLGVVSFNEPKEQIEDGQLYREITPEANPSVEFAVLLSEDCIA